MKRSEPPGRAPQGNGQSSFFDYGLYITEKAGYQQSRIKPSLPGTHAAVVVYIFICMGERRRNLLKKIKIDSSFGGVEKHQPGRVFY